MGGPHALAVQLKHAVAMAEMIFIFPAQIAQMLMSILKTRLRSLAQDIRFAGGGLVPNLEINVNKLLKLGANIKWTPTGTLASFLPFNWALRGALTKPTLTIVSGASKIDFASMITGVNLSVGKTFGRFETYLGYGAY